jgi:hypothetical protein
LTRNEKRINIVEIACLYDAMYFILHLIVHPFIFFHPISIIFILTLIFAVLLTYKIFKKYKPIHLINMSFIQVAIMIVIYSAVLQYVIIARLKQGD